MTFPIRTACIVSLLASLSFVGSCTTAAGPPPTTANTSTVPSSAASDLEEDVVPAQPRATAAHPSTEPPCQPNLAACPTNGCEDDGSPHALFNTLKRRTTAADGSPITMGSARVVTFQELGLLQTKADALIGEQVLPDAARRQLLASISVAGGTFGEGMPVRLRGYLAPHDPAKPASGTHEGGIESVNCRLTDQPSRDIHIPIVANVGDDECSGVVVEMIPQGRPEHPGWTKENIWKIQKEGRPVLFVGPLFYDSEHLKNADCAHLRQGQPKRMSLWEVHPVVEFYVCKAGHGCDPASSGDWSPVN